MPEALQRLTYDATVDDAVDVSLRLAKRTRAFQKQLHTNVVAIGVVGGLGFFAWLYYGYARPLNIPLALLGAGVFGAICAAIFRPFFTRELRRQHRKIIAEQLGGKPTMPSELELRPDAVWVRQAGMEMVFPWAICTGVQDNSDDIEINFTPGICVVRNRHFASPADRQAFLETARRLSAQRDQ